MLNKSRIGRFHILFSWKRGEEKGYGISDLEIDVEQIIGKDISVISNIIMAEEAFDDVSVIDIKMIRHGQKTSDEIAMWCIAALFIIGLLGILKYVLGGVI